jgi:outer membrane lipopolysaccharide assembly protein LptE/RlpB
MSMDASVPVEQALRISKALAAAVDALPEQSEAWAVINEMYADAYQQAVYSLIVQKKQLHSGE